MSNSVSPNTQSRWALRDLIAAGMLFVATFAVVLWQNMHLAVLWDLSYLLDSSARIALGQMPYRDFPFAHAPLTFLIQAVVIRLVGRTFFLPMFYTAIVGGLGTILTWRIALRTLRQRQLTAAWILSLFLAAPLTALGIYSIYPHPIYDCDCIFSILVAVWLLQRLTHLSAVPIASVGAMHAFMAGAALVVPLFFKQNIGLPFLLAACGGMILLIALKFKPRDKPFAVLPETPTFLIVLAGAFTTLVAAVVLLQLTVGVRNYLHWTVQFAAQRRLPGLAEMIGIYREPSLLWTLPSVLLALLLLHSRLNKIKGSRVTALTLFAAPFLWTLISLFRMGDVEDRAASLLALWPLLLIVAALMALYRLRTELYTALGAGLSTALGAELGTERGMHPSLCILFPILYLVAIHGTLMSQQLWGSTYALWPLLILLLAEMIASLNSQSEFQPYLPALAGIISICLLVCGGAYMASEERLSYVQIFDGQLVHATLPALKGMATRGPSLPQFEQLVRFAASDIPLNDGLILLNGEDPFYYATGRIPQFPVLLFDKATDPYSPAQLVELVGSRNIHWMIVKRNLQLKDDPMPQREETLQLLKQEFNFYRRLDNYDIYRR